MELSKVFCIVHFYLHNIVVNTDVLNIAENSVCWVQRQHGPGPVLPGVPERAAAADVRRGDGRRADWGPVDAAGGVRDESTRVRERHQLLLLRGEQQLTRRI